MNSEEPGTRNQEPASALGLEALLSEVRSCPAMGCRHSVPGRKLREKGGQASGLCDLVRQMSELLVPRLRLMVNDRTHFVSRWKDIYLDELSPGLSSDSSALRTRRAALGNGAGNSDRKRSRFRGLRD